MEKGFEQFKLNRQLWDAIAESGYENPTQIQKRAIPMILSGQDVVGIAQTGTGKTAAYVLPMLMSLKYAQGDFVRALILVPTRELAVQVHEHVESLSKYTDLRSVVVYGGVGMKQQIESVEKGLDILIATPGRFLDLYLANHINVRSLKYMVLDEADKMMDMGFIRSLHKIIEVVPRKRQNVLFSATMSELVRKISGDFLKFPEIVEITPQATTAVNVDQCLYEVPNFNTKISLLKYLLDQENDVSRLIVFVKTKLNAENVYRYLVRKYGDEDVRVLHANKGQNTRLNSINAFKEGTVRILVATDVAARGIDVSEVSHVINFDVPIVIEDYVHRIGRTGRAFNHGHAITFCNPAEKNYIEKIEKLIRQKIKIEPLPQSLEISATSFEERQMIAREIDVQKRKENPDFKGAFHEKKHVRSKKPISGGAKRTTSNNKPKGKKR